jgi:hypothetical protein
VGSGRKLGSVYSVVDEVDMGKCFLNTKIVRKLRFENDTERDATAHAYISSTTKGFKLIQPEFRIFSKGFVMLPIEVRSKNRNVSYCIYARNHFVAAVPQLLLHMRLCRTKSCFCGVAAEIKTEQR